MGRRLAKYVSGEQINYLGKPKAETDTDLRITDKSRYFAKTEFKNCFIIRSPSVFSYLNHSLAAQGSDVPFVFTQERRFNYA